MLPFLKKKQATAAAAPTTNFRAPDDKEKAEKDQQDGMHMAAMDLIRSVQSGDVKGTAEALRAAFEIADSEPHKEGEHTNETKEEKED